ncbi:MAG: hypothetical protein P1V97_37770, partial [Planctomycetota bacterium]|nr:hypothetical protein [Planctomycetota bacterium]
MSNDNSNDDRFFHLASLYLDAQTNDAEAAELAELLRDSPELRLELARMMRMHGALTQRGSLCYDQTRPSTTQSSESSAPKRPQTRRGRLRSRSRPPGMRRFAPLALAAAILVVIGLFGLVISKSAKPEQDPIAVQDPKSEPSSDLATPNSKTPKKVDSPPKKDPEKEDTKKEEPKNETPKKTEAKKTPKIEVPPKNPSPEPPKKIDPAKKSPQDIPKQADPNPPPKKKPARSV